MHDIPHNGVSRGNIEYNSPQETLRTKITLAKMVVDLVEWSES